MRTDRSELLAVFDKWFAVVREGQRNQPVSGQPTSYDAEQESVRQLFRWRGGRKRDRFIPIGGAQGIEPAGRMEDRRIRMSIDEFGPPIIEKRVYPPDTTPYQDHRILARHQPLTMCWRNIPVRPVHETHFLGDT